jgi:hypothetical protein
LALLRYSSERVLLLLNHLEAPLANRFCNGFLVGRLNVHNWKFLLIMHLQMEQQSRWVSFGVLRQE